MPHAPDLSGCALEDRYELHAVIGEGAFGRVYRARDRRLERIVAVKLIKPWWAEDPAWARSFEREAQLLARVSDPGIVQIFDVGEADEGLYYVSELVAGESLAARLARGSLAPWAAAEVAEQLCRALGRAHAAQVIHRDVKPANILLAPDGQVKVGDFGVARLAEGSSDGAGATVVGTPRYMAPEQARGHATTPATDVYSAGIVLYEMIAGQPPFTERAAVELALRHLQDPPPPLPNQTPEALIAVCARALAKSPDERFADGAEMARALRGARQGRGRSGVHADGDLRARTPPAPPAPGRHRRLDPTRRAPLRSRRRNVNPPARRRSIAALAGVTMLACVMALAAILIGGPSYVRVPRLLRLTLAGATARTAPSHLRIVRRLRSSWTVAQGLAIAQSPRSGQRVREGTTVELVISSGPPPATVPGVIGESVAAAGVDLQRTGLRMRSTQVPAPGMTPGTVIAQTPRRGSVIAQRSVVSISAAEVPRWRTVTTFAGQGGGRSVAFRIRGPRWRVISSMGYQGTCTFIIFCSGPSVRVVNLGGGPGMGFDLGEGAGQTHAQSSGSGLYQLVVSPGSDSARWSITVQDDY